MMHYSLVLPLSSARGPRRRSALLSATQDLAEVNSFVAERRQREQLGLAMPQRYMLQGSDSHRKSASTMGWASADRNAFQVGSIDVPAALLLTTTRSAAPAPIPDHVFRRRLPMGRSDVCYNSPVVPPAPPGVMSAPPSPRYGVRLAAASAARRTQPSYTPSDLFWPHGDWPVEENNDGTPGAGALVAAASLASMSEPPSWPWRSLRPSIAVVLPKGFNARTAAAAAEEEAVAEAVAVAAAVAAVATETVMAAVAAAVAAVAAEPPALDGGESVHEAGSTAHAMHTSAVVSSSFAGRRPPSQMQSRAEASMMASGAATSSIARRVTRPSSSIQRPSSSVPSGSPFAGSARLALEHAGSGAQHGASPLRPPSPAPALLTALDRLSGEGMFGAAGSGWRGGAEEPAPRPAASRGSGRSEIAISERRNAGISSVIPSYNTGRAAKVYSRCLPSLCMKVLTTAPHASPHRCTRVGCRPSTAMRGDPPASSRCARHGASPYLGPSRHSMPGVAASTTSAAVAAAALTSGI